MKAGGRTQRKGKKWLVGGRFGTQSVEPVTIGKILSTQKDLPASDLCALLDFQDSTVKSSLDHGGLVELVAGCLQIEKFGDVWSNLLCVLLG